MQIRQIVPNGETWTMDIKPASKTSVRVSSQITNARVCHLQQKMTFSWQQVLSHKYQYKYQYPVQQDWIEEFKVDSKAEYSALSSTRSQKKETKTNKRLLTVPQVAGILSHIIYYYSYGWKSAKDKCERS